VAVSSGLTGHPARVKVIFNSAVALEVDYIDRIFVKIMSTRKRARIEVGAPLALGGVCYQNGLIAQLPEEHKSVAVGADRWRGAPAASRSKGWGSGWGEEGRRCTVRVAHGSHITGGSWAPCNVGWLLCNLLLLPVTRPSSHVGRDLCATLEVVVGNVSDQPMLLGWRGGGGGGGLGKTSLEE
jgi:hypothetical protein